MILKPIPEYEAYAPCRVKYYYDGDILRPYELICFDRPTFKTSSSLEAVEYSDKSESDIVNDPAEQGREWLDKSMSRARRACRDIITNNADCGLFVTLTLDKEKIDRYDYNKIVKKLSVFLDNKVRRNGLKYLLIPEFHKDGAIHFHGFFNDVLPKTNSGHKSRGKVVWNIAFPYGFTTAVNIRGEAAAAKVANYCLKYMTKDSRKVGGRWYLHGGRLEKPLQRFFHFDLSEIPGETFNVCPGVAAKIVRDELTISELLSKNEVFKYQI